MLTIEIIPDTNIYIENLDLIENITNDTFDVTLLIKVTKTVLVELDGLKQDFMKARRAIRFINKNAEKDVIILEGHYNDNMMEIEEEKIVFERPKNNDEKILQSVSKEENGCLLTNDIIMHHKALAHNIKSVCVNNHQKYTDVINMIIKQFVKMEDMEIETNITEVESIKKKGVNMLLPVVADIVISKIGREGYYMARDNLESGDFDKLVDFIYKEFYLFTDFLPFKSKNTFKNFPKKSTNKEEVKVEVRKILLLFRVNPVTIS